MTKPRVPLTVPHAVTKVVGLIGAAAAAEAADRSTRMVYNWMDPDSDDAPTVLQAMALDLAYRAAGGDGAPIFELYAELLGEHYAQLAACQMQLADDLAIASKEFGEAAEATIAVVKPNAGPREIHHAMTQVEEAHSAVGTLLRRLKNFLPFGAGPGAAKAGGAQ